MLIAVGRGNSSEYSHCVRSMFAERKSVFVDLLKWDVPVLHEKYEIDQFDDEEALYLILLDAAGEHVGSARLLRTDRPHLLDSLYPDLCHHAVPQHRSVREITRFCLSRRLTARERKRALREIVSGLAEYALLTGISAYTAITDLAFLQQILAFGWECRPLGLPKKYGGSILGALQIEITDQTIALLRQGGVYTDVNLQPGPIHEIA